MHIVKTRSINFWTGFAILAQCISSFTEVWIIRLWMDMTIIIQISGWPSELTKMPSKFVKLKSIFRTAFKVSGKHKVVVVSLPISCVARSLTSPDRDLNISFSRKTIIWEKVSIMRNIMSNQKCCMKLRSSVIRKFYL